ncbi:hypothetical protein INH39_25475 [Massilia violaceinigra]|uniref:Replicative helicase inhibitor G39P N-terminal domain-containing protein n=1 Tax=Massilia violaceinigra TaxID=2045208 RepID=A0ABY4A2Z6_9BURK|nr:hypothetical protein [Massilia violaceinigra]UOD28762.1 hypothetical protein INH39_25475 [Massilia violaceinigra]
MKTEIAKAIALLTAEYDLPAFSPDRIAMWMEALCHFPRGSVTKSAENYMRTNKFKPQLADIVQGCVAQMPNAWLSADEAWALMPKSEMDSCMLTNESAQAMAAASPLLEAGDRIAARMAFRAAYERLVENAEIEGRQPAFFPSFGDDVPGRARMLGAAVRAGQYQLEAAINTVPEFAHEIVQLAGVPKHPLLAAPSQQGRERLGALLLTMRGHT